jgi:hypothetical protein
MARLSTREDLGGGFIVRDYLLLKPPSLKPTAP